MIYRTKNIFFLLLIGFILSCNSTVKKDRGKNSLNSAYNNQIDVKGFRIEEKNAYRLLTISSNNQHFRYVLFENSKSEIKEDNAVFIKVPIQSMVCLSATQIAAADKLDLLDEIIGISEAKYMKHKEVLNKIEDGGIYEIMAGGEMNTEKLLSLHPDIVFSSSLPQKHQNLIETHKITVFPYLDHFEHSPLVRAEWIKVMGILFGKEKQANLIYDSIAKQYYELKELASKTESQPGILSGKAYGETWWVPGGKSYMASLFKDANYNYYWRYNENNGSLSLDFESVYHKSINTDYWIILVHDEDGFSYDKLVTENPLYGNMKAFKEKKIICCNTAKTNYFEESPLEPHIILADLLFATHKDLIPEYQPKYFKHLIE